MVVLCMCGFVLLCEQFQFISHISNIIEIVMTFLSPSAFSGYNTICIFILESQANDLHSTNDFHGRKGRGVFC